MTRNSCEHTTKLGFEEIIINMYDDEYIILPQSLQKISTVFEKVEDELNRIIN